MQGPERRAKNLKAVGDIGDLKDVVLTTAAAGDLLQFDGTNFTNTKSLTGSYSVAGDLTVSTDLTVSGTSAFACDSPESTSACTCPTLSLT